ncbi:hypothetical protein AQUCO_03300123v1 [Aquilegia coerulea]|uniref:Uncharacterized protein n=1 Tax=Aquilegia coerulea TaxID=218851 RepID=A0A2G5CZJ9_AQUCA|nr:hypothetical protein AQUCO_03300123v1 [Aquilegia coerulea]
MSKNGILWGRSMFSNQGVSSSPRFSKPVTSNVSAQHSPKGFTSSSSHIANSSQSSSSINSPVPITKLTLQEMKVRRDKNLCYNCDEVYSPGHKCNENNCL